MKTRNALPDLAHRLIRRAAHRAPAPLAQRLEEEWLADLASRTAPLARLRLAIGCCWATGIITRECGVPQFAVSGTSATPKTLGADLGFDLPRLSGRTAIFILIAAIHVLIIYAFASGFAQHLVAAIPSVMDASVTQEARPQRIPPTIPTTAVKPVLVNPWEPVAPTVPKIEIPPETGQATTSSESTGPGPAQPLPPRSVQRVMGGPGSGFPTTDEYYPSASRRLAETGVATVLVCVDTRGRLVGEPTLSKSSGIRRIDNGALNLARAGSGHYRPTTEDGRPVSACYPYRIRFELNN